MLLTWKQELLYIDSLGRYITKTDLSSNNVGICQDIAMDTNSLNLLSLYKLVDHSEDKKIWQRLTDQNGSPQMLQYNSTNPNDTSFNVLSNTSVYSQSYGLNVSVVCGTGSHHIFLTLIHRTHSELGIGHKDFTLDKLHNRETNFVKSYKPNIIGAEWLLYSNIIPSNKRKTAPIT